MPKKFIQPDWRQLRKMNELLQRSWFYIWDNCDEAGVYHYDEDYLKLDLNTPVAPTIEQLGSLPECQVISGERVLIKNFLNVNISGVLKFEYNPHKPIFRAIEKNGAENFIFLDLDVESGPKGDKKIEAIKLFFKLENKSVRLEEEDIDVDGGEDVDEDRKGGMGEKQIVPQMLKRWVDKNPTYPTDEQKDAPAILRIAKFIAAKEALKFSVTDKACVDRVLTLWEHLCDHIPKDNFFRNYSIQQVDKHIQSIVLSIQNGKSNSTNGKSNQPVTSQSLNEAHAKYFGSK